MFFGLSLLTRNRTQEEPLHERRDPHWAYNPDQIKPPPSMLLRAASVCRAMLFLFTAVARGGQWPGSGPPSQLCNLPSAILEGEEREGRERKDEKRLEEGKGRKRNKPGRRSTYHD